MKRKFWILVAAFLVSGLLVASAQAMEYRVRPQPGPRLISPDDNMDITGMDKLEFRWHPGDSTSFDHYDFRLYKGSQTYESGLLVQKDLPPSANTTTVESTQFKDGETYAWAVRQIGTRKSRSSYSVFKVIKKEG